MKTRAPVAAGFLVLMATGCGYFFSGTWTDDPKNFERAWGAAKPPDVEMVHSWYWRSAHFTREEAYFFAFRRHDQLLRGFVAANQMRLWGSSDVKVESPQYCFDKPTWFTPKSMPAYDVWAADAAGAWVFSDKETGDFFVYACQM